MAVRSDLGRAWPGTREEGVGRAETSVCIQAIAPIAFLFGRLLSFSPFTRGSGVAVVHGGLPHSFIQVAQSHPTRTDFRGAPVAF